MQKLALAVLGVLWTVGFFMLGLHLTFPGEALRDRLVYEVDDASRGEMLLELAGTAPWRATGVSLESPRLYSVPRARRGEESVPELLVQADRVSARALPSKLVGGDVGVAFDAELYGGDVVGTVIQTDETSDIEAEVEGLDLARYPFDFDGGSVDLSGTFDAVVDIVFDAADVKQSSGTLELELPGLAIGEGSKVAGFDLPPMTFTEAVLSFDIDDGRAEVEEGVFLSDVLEAELSGEISLAMPLMRSRLSVDVELTLLDEKLATLADLYGDMKRAKTDDGAYLGGVIGTFERPSWRWNRSSSSSLSGSSRTTTLRSPRTDFDPDEVEARRDERQDRIRERRDRLQAEEDGGSPVRPRSDDEEYDDEEYDDEEYDDEEYEDDEGFEADFERASTPRRLPGAEPTDGRETVGLPEPDYDDVPPPDFSNDIRPDEMD